MQSTQLFKILVAFMLTSTSAITAQQYISGTVSDSEFNDILPFANILIKGTTTGTTSDFDGKYSFEIEPGIYTLVFSYVGYQTLEISDVEVKRNEEVVIDVTLNAANALDEVVVTTTVSKNTEVAVLQVQKSSVKLLDGLSLQSIKRTGASDIASAVKTVPGVSVQRGKYVYVRGLGDRYTKTTLNGMDIPGLDPDRNTLQLDLFPTVILDNIQVVKSFTPESSADFTGGFVDIVTKDIPTRAEYSLSIGTSYNSSMHFRNDFLTSGGSSTDFLGFDDGQRNLAIGRNENIPPPSAGDPRLTQLTQRFNPEMAVKQDNSLMNFNFSFSAGNSYAVGKESRLGFLANISYRNTTEFYENAENSFWFKTRSSSSIFEMEPERLQKGNIGINDVLSSGLLGITLKTPRSKYKFNALHIQNGFATNAFFDVENTLFDEVRGVRDNIEYTERSITNMFLEGNHSNQDGSWNVNWKLSPTLSRIQDKDVRFASFEITDAGDLFIRPSSLGPPTRIWRDLEEINLAGKLNLSNKHDLFGRPAILKFGGSYTYKSREFGIDQYFFNILLPTNSPINGNSDNILIDENIWTPETGTGTFVLGNFEPANSFEAYSTLAGVYLSEEFQLSERLKSILGVRFEKFDLFYTGQNNTGTVVLLEEKVIEVEDFFPSANFIYDFDDDGNSKLRASFSRTTARPSFKEASVAEIFDPLTNRVFVGNLDVEPTYINNYDLRFERYGESGQFFAVSGFYKTFENPIELVAFESAPDNFKPQNVEKARVIGAELELRQSLKILDPSLNGISLNANVSIIQSEVDMSETEFNSRQLAARDGETIDDTRQLQGQAPFLINFGINYQGEEDGWQMGMFYNVQGKTLEVVGIRSVPDVYTLPFHNLNLNISKSFGKEKNSKISLRFSNLLDDRIESVYQSFRATDQIYSFRNPGQAMSLSYSVNF